MTARLIALLCASPFVLLTIAGIVATLLNIRRYGVPEDDPEHPLG